MTTTASHQTAELEATPEMCRAMIEAADHLDVFINADDARTIFSAALKAQARATGTQGASELPPLPAPTSGIGFRTDQIEDYGRQCYQLALQRKGEPADNAQGFSLWFSREDWGVIFDGVMLDIERSEKRKQANSESVSDVRAEAGRAILTAINLRTPITAPQASREVPEGFIWPEPPPSKGQSHVLFEDGYAEGWAKAIDTVRKALAAAPSPASAEDADGAALRLALKHNMLIDLGPGGCHVRFGDRTPSNSVTELGDRRSATRLAIRRAAQLDGSQKAGGAA